MTRCLPLALVLAACGAVPEPAAGLAGVTAVTVPVEELPGDLAAAVVPMTLASNDPFVLGTRVTITVTGAPPNAFVALFGTLRTTGRQFCPPELVQTCSDLRGAVQMLTTGRSNASGALSFEVNLPTTLPVGAVGHLQALSKKGADEFKSNVVDKTFYATAPGTLTTVPAVRAGTAGVVPGDLLRVEGLVVNGVGAKGFTAQDPTAPVSGGVYVFTNGTVSGVGVGDVIDVVGEYAEYAGTGGGVPPLGTLAELIVLPTLADSSVAVVGSGTLSPIPVSVATLSDPSLAEPYEGMLVTLGQATGLEVVDVDAFSEMTVVAPGQTPEAVIDNEFFSFPFASPDVGPGASFDAVTGAVYFSFGEHKVAPRSLADLPGYVPPVVDTDTDTDVTPTGTLLLSEICDYGPDLAFRFVEVHNPTGAAVDLAGYAIRRYSNGATSPGGTVALGPGTLPAGGTWVVGSSSTADWAGTFSGFVPQQFSGQISANGNDVYTLALYDGTAYVDLDAFGQIGVDGAGTAWEFTDQIAVRTCAATGPTPPASFDVGDWTISDSTNATPGAHCEP